MSSMEAHPGDVVYIDGAFILLFLLLFLLGVPRPRACSPSHPMRRRRARTQTRTHTLFTCTLTLTPGIALQTPKRCTRWATRVLWARARCTCTRRPLAVAACGWTRPTVTKLSSRWCLTTPSTGKLLSTTTDTNTHTHTHIFTHTHLCTAPFIAPCKYTVIFAVLCSVALTGATVRKVLCSQKRHHATLLACLLPQHHLFVPLW